MVGDKKHCHIVMWREGMPGPVAMTVSPEVMFGLIADTARYLDGELDPEANRSLVHKLRTEQAAFHANPLNRYSKAFRDKFLDFTDVVSSASDMVAGPCPRIGEILSAMLEANK